MCDLDYLIQTNLMAFLIFWKTGRYDQAMKYVELCRNYIYMILSTTEE